MSQCLNCKAKLGCGCQKRTASDGKSCCANCIVKYENELKAAGKKTQSLNEVKVENVFAVYMPNK